MNPAGPKDHADAAELWRVEFRQSCFELADLYGMAYEAMADTVGPDCAQALAPALLPVIVQSAQRAVILREQERQVAEQQRLARELAEQGMHLRERAVLHQPQNPW